MTCGFTEEIYGLYVLGLLEDEECSQLDVHICRPCETCVAAVRSARATWCAVGASAPDIKPPGGMRDRLLSRYNPHVPWWRIRLPVFGSTAVGTRETLGVPVQDSAPIDETITGVTLTGTGAAAFQVTTDFPLAVPAGTSALVAVQFAPTSAGMATATLVLQTASMGPSPIPLQGEGL